MGIFFRYQKTGDVLQVDDTYAYLAAVLPNGDLQFEFTYSVSQYDVISFGAPTVSVTVFCRNVPAKAVLGSPNVGTIDVPTVVNNIRTQLPDAKTTLQQRASYVLAQRNSDVTAAINNDIIPQLRAQVPPAQVQQLNVPGLRLVPVTQVKQGNDSQPVLHRVASSLAVPSLVQALSGSYYEVPQALMQDMVTRLGLDPSVVTALTKRSASATDSVQGFSNPSTANELPTDPGSRLLNYFLFPATDGVPPQTTDDLLDSELVQVVQTLMSDIVEVPVTVVVPKSLMRLEGADVTKLYVRFDLVNAVSNEPVASVTKSLDVTQHLQVYNTPLRPPVLKAKQSAASTRVNIEVTQVDPGATYFVLMKKEVYTASPDVATYSPAGIYFLKASERSLIVQVDQPMQSAVVYRAIPHGGTGLQGSEYTNVVLKPARYTPLRAIALTASQVANGVQLEVRNIPLKVVAVQLLRWNMTTFDRTYATVNGDVGFIDDATRQLGVLTTVDSDVFSSNVYRYVARLVYADGMTEDFGDATIEFLQPAPGQVDTSITNMVVSHDGTPNVAFDIVTSTVDTDLDAVKRMLSTQDQQQFFQGDLQAQRDQLKALVAHNVQRVDLTTGKREDFGTLTVTHFDDAALRSNLAIDQLQYGHDYRYEVLPLLRAAGTLFDSLQTELVDGTTNKPYTFDPAKFLHPLALTRGVLVSALGARQRYGKDPMAYGIVGDVTTVAASFDNDKALIVSQAARRFDRHTNIVGWRLQGDITQVDHFLVMKEVHGVRTVVGKAHSHFPLNACQYNHRVTSADNGSVAYVIVPVMNDYTVGAAATTNTLVVDAP